MASDHTEAEDTLKSAEDRKTASALATLTDEASPQARGDVDQAAVSAAMKKLGGGRGGVDLPIRRNVKIEQGDVALLVGFPALLSLVLLRVAGLEDDWEEKT